MTDGNDEPAIGNKLALTQHQFDNLPISDLAKLAGHEETERLSPTCEEVLKLSEKRFFECLEKGFDKSTTAAIIAQHPLNSAQPSAIERAMNGVFGNWRDLERATRRGKVHASSGHNSPQSSTPNSRGPSPHEAASKARSLTDDTFSGEEML
ncbi:hypothetical protein AAG596_01110 [Citromicrobium bathyomarinum]|uniref:hypothetical protein n=1 Tax=Citromicrobium bathyomarinum TaxID=72174 RepID=UPI00315AC3D7